MADRFVSRVSVTLAAGASTTVAHGLIVNGAAVVPQKIEVDRISAMQVDSATSTTITVSNPGKSSSVAIFLCTYIHSIQAKPADTAPGWWWKGGFNAGSTSPFLPDNAYYVDSTATASATLRVYPTVAEAVVAAEAEQADDYVLILREGQAHSWTGASFSGLLNASIVALGRASLTLAAGGLAAGTSTLTIENIDIAHTGTFTSTSVGNPLVLNNCTVTSLTGQAFSTFKSFSATTCAFTGTRVPALGTGGIALRGCTWAPGAGFVVGQQIISFNAACATHIIASSSFTLEGADDAVLLTRTAGATVVHLYNVAITMYNEGPGGTQALFNGAMSVTHSGVTVTSIGGSAVNVQYGTAGTEANPGLIWYGLSPSDNNLPEGTIRSEQWFTTNPGAAATNTSMGIGQFAIGAATCTITNPYVTANSAILASLMKVDATLTQLLTVVPGAGSFTVTGNGVATAATAFSWQILPHGA
jgi:hypothetical protein